MKTRKTPINRRKANNGNRAIYSLFLVIILICASLFTLKWFKDTNELLTPPVADERHKLPSRKPFAHIEMQPYTSSVSEHRPHHKKKAVYPGTVAIIVDDMGSSLQEANSLMGMNIPLTFSIIPGLPKARELDKVANERGYQILIHIPMEPKGYPQQRLEENGLLLSQTDDEEMKRINAYFKQVPHASGANNHMGSRFTEDEQKMRIVLNQLKAHGLFYVDSRTTPNSVGLTLAKSMEIDSAGRNVFLDNDKDIASITSQLEQLALLARKKGSAIGICHPYKTTIQALAMNLPRLKAEGISFVPVGDLVR
jgi:polysaccharide deacetylase 2 family uncharacterized protein YibQ